MYTTVASVLANLGTFSTLIKGTLSDNDIAAHIEESDKLIDGYIAAAVTLPFSTVPKLLTVISTDITVRNLWALRQAKDLPEHVKTDYDTAIKNLIAIAKGSLKLTAEDPESDTYNSLKYTAAGRVFTGSL
jgi:phage gp36-like protein